MKLSTIACGVGLLGVLTHCGSGTGGSAGSIGVGQGDPGGPYAGSGSSGPLEQGQNPSNPFGRFVSGGAQSGQGSAGPYSDPGTAGPFAPTPGTVVNCGALCAKLATVPCVRDTPQAGNNGNGNGAAAPRSCEDDCVATLAQINTDCLRSLYGAYLSCVMSAALTCHNGDVQASSCAEPKSNQCATGTVGSGDNNPTPVERVDAGR